MVLVLGDDFEFFLEEILRHSGIGQESTYFFFLFDLSHELFDNEMMFLPRLMHFPITKFSSVRESLMRKIFTRVQIHQAQNYF